MPTRNRREYIPQAVACFERQTWPNKQLVVVDNGDEPICDLLPDGAQYHYIQATPRQTTGWMRNHACDIAAGEYICHWDDDDWSAPTRMEEQYRLLIQHQIGFVGYRSMYFLDEADKKAWLYQGQGPYALGTSFFYRRQYWICHRFPDVAVGEDNAFVDAATNGRLVSVDAGDRMVARIHPGNTSAKCISPEMEHWIAVDYGSVEALVR